VENWCAPQPSVGGREEALHFFLQVRDRLAIAREMPQQASREESIKQRIERAPGDEGLSPPSEAKRDAIRHTISSRLLSISATSSRKASSNKIYQRRCIGASSRMATLITLSVPALLRQGASQALRELVRIGALAGTPICLGLSEPRFSPAQSIRSSTQCFEHPSFQNPSGLRL
jgi:hypothetical protein